MRSRLSLWFLWHKVQWLDRKYRGPEAHNQWNERKFFCEVKFWNDLVLSCERGNQKLISFISWHSPMSSLGRSWIVKSSDYETLIFLVINMVVGLRRYSAVTTRLPGENSIPWQPGTRRGPNPWQSRCQERIISREKPGTRRIQSLPTSRFNGRNYPLTTRVSARSCPKTRDNPTSRGVPCPVTTCCLKEIPSRDTSPAL